jgi:hypothetical protein
MHPARRQDRNGIDIFPRTKCVDIVVGGYPELGRYGVGARMDRVANGDKFGPLDMTATQQFRMTLRNAPAPKQPKPDHQNVPLNRLIGSNWLVAPRIREGKSAKEFQSNIDQYSLSMEAAATGLLSPPADNQKANPIQGRPQRRSGLCPLASAKPVWQSEWPVVDRHHLGYPAPRYNPNEFRTHA